MHIESVTILVNDYDAAIEFFVGALGFELVKDSPSLTNDGRAKRWVIVRPPGATTGVLLAQADGEQQSASVGNRWDLLGMALGEYRSKSRDVDRRWVGVGGSRLGADFVAG